MLKYIGEFMHSEIIAIFSISCKIFFYFSSYIKHLFINVKEEIIVTKNSLRL